MLKSCWKYVERLLRSHHIYYFQRLTECIMVAMMSMLMMMSKLVMMMMLLMMIRMMMSMSMLMMMKMLMIMMDNMLMMMVLMMYHFDYHIIYAHHAYLRLSRSSTNSECDPISAPTIYPVSESEYCTVVTIIILCYSIYIRKPTQPGINPSIYFSIHLFIHLSMYLSTHRKMYTSNYLSIVIFINLAFVTIYLRFHLTLSAKL